MKDKKILRLTAKGEELYELTKDLNPSAVNIIHEVKLNPNIPVDKYYYSSQGRQGYTYQSALENGFIEEVSNG